MWTVVEEAIEQDVVVMLARDKPLPSRLTPRGPDEGWSTRDPELAALLEQQAAAAAEHPWWGEHPDIFESL